MGLNRVWKARTSPGNSKINLLILSRLRVRDSVLRERLLGAGLWPETAHSLRTENLSVLFRVDREERKPVGLPPPFYQPPPPASTLTGLSLGGQIREKDPTGSPSDPVLQLREELTVPRGFHNERPGWMEAALANASWLTCRPPPPLFLFSINTLTYLTLLLPPPPCFWSCSQRASYLQHLFPNVVFLDFDINTSLFWAVPGPHITSFIVNTLCCHLS